MHAKYRHTVTVIIAAACSCLGCGGKEGASDEFLAARQMVVDGKYAAAAQSLENYVDKNPQASDASRAGLFLGKAFLAQNDLVQAEKWFQWTVDNHPRSLEGHKCRYKLAVCALLSGERDDALKRFQDLAASPDGPLAAEATAMERFVRNHDFGPPPLLLPAAGPNQ